ncbi:MAG: nicotinate (nicotinamide) nucleotide adenylyltransferase [Clostridia bacterium]|nr:nicotinate (nicotinamide) nucleotide adenylyltransferase [Clostridia bacterium]MBQ4623202.1 nicotinate (nicotinamide) nucleotide adenylyltransferase [Clostridia bacterium]
MEKRRIGMFGGTFNPPHLGHKHLALHAIQACSLSELILMPAGIPPHKVMPEGSATPEGRYEMTCLMAEEIPEARVSRHELDRAGASYTYMTLQHLKKIYPEDELVLIMGGDMFLTLDHWREAETIFHLASIAPAARTEEDIAMLREKEAEYKCRFGATIYPIQAEVLEMSSSQIRDAIKRGEGNLLLPESVNRYVKRMGLYQ